MDDDLILETDQIFCYGTDGQAIPCDGSGQDAAFAKPLMHRRPHRFQAAGPVVEDTWTGAVWSRDADPAQFPLTWREAQAFVAEMAARRAHGYGDWQLPSRRLLFSLVSHQRINPAVPRGHPFENIFDSYYWTGQTCRRLPDQAWYLHLGGGRIYRGMKHGSYMVWPVCPAPTSRSEVSLPPGSQRFTVDGDTVRDTETGLMWTTAAGLDGRRLTWQAALATVADFNRQKPGGYNDWRLPNIRELESLVDLDAHSPALPDGHLFANVQEGYWSSTTSVYEPRYAWVLYSMDGAVGVGFKPRAEFFVWPMRRTWAAD